MRVFYLSESTVPSRTANSIQVMKMCQAMAQEGHEVTLLAPSRSEAEAVGSIWHHYGVQPLFSVKWLPAPGPLWSYLYGLVAAGYCWWRSADVVHARHLPGALLSTLTSRPVLYEAHLVPPGRLGPTTFSLLLRRRYLKAVVVISHALLSELTESWPHLADRVPVVVAPDGVDLERFEHVPPPDVARARLGMEPAHGFVAGYAGHLYPGRGIELILDVAGALPEVRFAIIGGNPDDVRTFQRIVLGEGLDNVTLKGFVPNAELPIHLAACDILLMPYQHRVAAAGGVADISQWLSPMKMFEYMAAGRAILASDLPVLREVLGEGNAVLLQPDDRNAWRSAIETLAKNPGWRAALARQAREDVEQYAWRRRVARCLAAVGEGATVKDTGEASP